MQKAAIKLLQKLTIKKYIEGYGMLQRNIFILLQKLDLSMDSLGQK